MSEPRRRAVILVTGFGGFPGAPRNPTERLAAVLGREAPRFARLGIDVRSAVLPVRYDGLRARLDALSRDHRPDAWLMLGVAGRRRRLCVELVARNRAAPIRPDAAGRLPAQALVAGGPARLRSSLPCRRVATALAAAGLPAQLSRDAGDYLCNAALYHALAGSLAPLAGFLHVPPPVAPQSRRALRRPPSRGGVTLADLARAVRLAVLALAPAANDVARQRERGRSETPIRALQPR